MRLLGTDYMSLLTDLQTRILYAIVEESRLSGWRVPRGHELLSILREKDIGHINNVRGLNDHLKRLQRKADCFESRGRNRHINLRRLCTEPEAALYLSILDEISVRNRQPRVSKERLHNFLASYFEIDADILERMFEWLRSAEYITEAAFSPGSLEVSERTKDQRRYLELLASRFEWQTALERNLEDFAFE